MTTRTRIVLTVVIAAVLVLYLIPFIVVGTGGWWSFGVAALALIGLVAIWYPGRRRTEPRSR